MPTVPYKKTASRLRLFKIETVILLSATSNCDPPKVEDGQIIFFDSPLKCNAYSCP